MPDLPLDETEAARAIGMFDMLRLPDVGGRPTMKEAAGPWQRDIVRAIFGSLVDGVRKVPEVFVMVPKKNSKTTGGAAITLTGLLMNIRPRAEFIYIGPTQEVAEIAFSQTVGMIEADDFLAERFHIAFHTKSITDRVSKARLKIKTFDMKVVTGSKPVVRAARRTAPDVDDQRRRQGDRPDQGRHAAQSRGCAGDDHDTVRHAACWRLQERTAIRPRRQGRADQGRADAAAAVGVSRGDADRPGQAVEGSGQLADGAAQPRKVDHPGPA